MRGLVLGTQHVDEAIVRLASAEEAAALLAGPPEIGILPVQAGSPLADAALVQAALHPGAELFVRAAGATDSTARLYMPGTTRIAGTFEVAVW